MSRRRKAVLTLVASLPCLPATAGDAPPAITHGTAVGDVTAASAVVWARADAAAEMTVEVAAEATPASSRRFTAVAVPERDFAAAAAVSGLAPGTEYRYRVAFENAGGVTEAATGSFATAPAPDDAAPVRFVVGGDVGGQGYCRDAETGYAIFRAMDRLLRRQRRHDLRRQRVLGPRSGGTPQRAWGLPFDRRSGHRLDGP